ncbi:GroES-like protein [Terfezia boudieri ATCC MYA-4762]|uniref:D-xylulose reductase n=1 Tax=Terfezia boudieri ATCC MYA-4762 TaxID=1051890 RepID=A0A3N4L6B3_9PEZI|nr:GroES-like protein [Terfezia boudieri ATCC MYA-4762]
MPSQNLSFVLKKPHEVTFEDRPVPELKSDRDVLVQVKITGICGSDVHYWQHGRIGDFVVKAPMVLGHESSGIIAKVGPAVTTVKVGQQVALEPGIPCRYCVPCKAGKYNLCPDMKFAATPPYDGTLAKFYVLPEDFCVPLPENVSLEEGALVEPLSVGVHIMKQAEIKPGQSIVVFGVGPIGLLCCAVARAFGASKVIAVDINQDRLNFALKYAATGTFNPMTQVGKSPAENAETINGLFRLTVGADVAVDASGAQQSIVTAIHALRNGGTFVQAGMGRPDIEFPIVTMCCKEITMKGSFRYGPGDYKLAVDLIATGKVSVKELVTGRVKFGQAEEAFNQVLGGKGIKVLIEGVEDDA